MFVKNKSITDISPESILKKAALFLIFQNREATITGETQNIKLIIPKRTNKISETNIAISMENIVKPIKDNLRIFTIFSSTILFLL